MRLAAVLVSLTVAAIHPVLAADPPTPVTSDKNATAAVQGPVAAATSEPTSATPSSAPATATGPATTAATAATEDPEAARLEKRMHARGYMTWMQNGEKMFCHREQTLGTRLGGTLHCMTVDEARVNESRMRQDEELLRQRVMGSCLPNGTGKGANCGN